MKTYKLDISADQMNRVFPFHIIIGPNGLIKSLGKSNLKMGFGGIDKPFDEICTIVRPYIEYYSFAKYKELTDDLIILKFLQNKELAFRGEFEYFKDEELIVFIGSPWFGRIDDLKKNNLTIHDFAKHDPLLDLLNILKSQEITNQEIKELLINVNEQKNKIVQSNKQYKLLQSFLDSSTDAVQVAKIDGTLFYINDEASERLAIKKEDVDQYNVSDFEKVFEDPKTWEGHIDDLRSTDKIIIEGVNENQSTGKTFPVEVTVKLATIGNSEFVIASSRDITNRKAMESHLAIQEKKYKNIIANMNLGLVELDLDQNVIFANQGFIEISGYELEELVGNKLDKIFKNELANKLILEKIELRKKGLADTYELEIVNKQDEKRWWFISGAPNYKEDGELIGSIGIYLDITEQKLLEKELEIAKDNAEQASKAKELFLANMSHEIRTPLNAIIGMIRELKREDLTKKQQTYLNHTDSASKHLLSIVNSILDISKIEAGEFILDHHDFSLESLAGNIKSILFNKAKDKNLDFKMDIDQDIFDAHLGDSVRLKQVMINLIDNAIKFTQTGYVNLSIKVLEYGASAQKLRLVFSDTGIGMNEEYLDKLFSKFSQEELSTSRKYGGTGLGMSITREIVHLMGGEISVESEKNKGTKITIELNLSKGDVTKLLDRGHDVDIEALSGVSILLVEDNAMNRFIASKSLENFGCVIDEAENGLIALEKLEKKDYDVILMDIQMPELDGLETTKIIRAKLKKSTPIIALSANAFRKDIDHYMSMGMNDYVTKPFKEKELFKSIYNQFNNFSKQNSIMPIQIYDLGKLYEVGGGDKKFVQGMIEIFVDSIPKSLDEIDAAFLQKDYHKISQVAHKIKPNIGYLGMKKLEEIAKEIELMSNEQIISHDELGAKIYQLRLHLEGAIQNLKQEL